MKLIRKCCKCKREHVDFTWRDPNESLSNNVLYTHGLCPECYSAIISALEADSSPFLQTTFHNNLFSRNAVSA